MPDSLREYHISRKTNIIAAMRRYFHNDNPLRFSVIRDEISDGFETIVKLFSPAVLKYFSMSEFSAFSRLLSSLFEFNANENIFFLSESKSLYIPGDFENDEYGKEMNEVLSFFAGMSIVRVSP